MRRTRRSSTSPTSLVPKVPEPLPGEHAVLLAPGAIEGDHVEVRIQSEIGRSPLHRGDHAALCPEPVLLRSAGGVERQHRLYGDAREPARRTVIVAETGDRPRTVARQTQETGRRLVGADEYGKLGWSRPPKWYETPRSGTPSVCWCGFARADQAEPVSAEGRGPAFSGARNFRTTPLQKLGFAELGQGTEGVAGGSASRKPALWGILRWPPRESSRVAPR